MCADPRSPVWRRGDPERRVTHDVDVGPSASPDSVPWAVQSVPTVADGVCGDLPSNLTDRYQMEA
jgi:hypothetical protein